MIQVALAFTATVKLGRDSTSGVRYAESVDTRRPLESMNVTIKRYSNARIFVFEKKPLLNY